MLKHAEAEQFYDAFGSKQDKQFYEDSAIDDLIEHGNFAEAASVVEFGCGTGKLGSRLLREVLPDDCRYLGIDVSKTMIDLCRENTERYSDRSRCLQSDGQPRVDCPDQSVDRFVSTYVLDLLADQDITSVIEEAYRVLLPGGYLCLAGLTHGVSPVSRLVEAVWKGLFRLRSTIVGGCRPLDMTGYLPGDRWDIVHDSTIVSFGIASEVLIAKRR